MPEESEFQMDPTARDRIGRAWLKLIEDKIKDGTINATEQAILVRLLISSGYTLDPTRLPQGLQTKLTESMDLNDPATAEELGILPIRRNA